MKEIKTSIHLPIEERLPEKIDVQEPEIVIRRTPIKAEWVRQYGFTKGCHGCDAIRRGKPPRNHNEHCRAAVEELIRKNEPERWQKAIGIQLA